MSLTPEQRQVLSVIQREAKRRGAPRKHLLAAVETGLVESGLRNLNHGDADSKGWRQERASLYKNPTNLVDSVKRFFDEAAQHDQQGITAGELAARVQRPAEQYRGRYQENKGKAKALLEGLGSSYNPSQNPAITGSPEAVDPQLRQQLLLNYLHQRGNPQALLELQAGLSSLNAPSATAAKTKNTGGKRIESVSSKLFEVFAPHGFNIDNGQRQSRQYVTDHEDHAHVAGNKAVLAYADKIAPKFGLVVTSGTRPGDDGFHGSAQAKDYGHPTGDKKAMTAFAKAVARRFR